MKIQWLRILLGGLLMEVVLAAVLIGGFAAAGVEIAAGVSTASAVIIGAGCFAGSFVVALLLARGVANQRVLHAFLMGVVATMLYLGLVAGSGQMATALAAYGPSTFVIVNGLRVVGAILGGVAAERRMAGPAIVS